MQEIHLKQIKLGIFASIVLVISTAVIAGPAEPEYDDDSASRDQSVAPSDFVTTGPVGAIGKMLTRPNTTATQEHEDRIIGEEMSKNWRQYQPKD